MFKRFLNWFRRDRELSLIEAAEEYRSKINVIGCPDVEECGLWNESDLTERCQNPIHGRDCSFNWLFPDHKKWLTDNITFFYVSSYIIGYGDVEFSYWFLDENDAALFTLFWGTK